MAKTTYEKYLDGELTADEALAETTKQLALVGDHLDGWKQQWEAVRDIASRLVEHAFNGKAEVKGFGKLENTSAFATARYKKEKVDAVLAKLTKEGHPLANELASAREESYTSGSFRITRDKSGK